VIAKVVNGRRDQPAASIIFLSHSELADLACPLGCLPGC
jgi:hypothetical protein